MDLTSWALYAFIAAAALAGAVLHYRRREPAGKGRVILGVLRGAALAVLALLLFDPAVPVGGTGDGRGLVVLVDGSASMGLPAAHGGTAWEEARAVVDSVGAGRVLVFGSGEAMSVAALPDSSPSVPRSRLAPALRSALEAGARRVLVVTDGEVEDALEAERIASAGGAGIAVRRVGDGGAGNLGLTSVEAPAWLEVGQEAIIRVTVTARGTIPADSVTVVVLRDSVELGRATAPAPDEGRALSVSVPVVPSEAAPEPVRLGITVTPGGAVAEDDVRYEYVRISDEPAGVALVSFRPDQEPRFLLPVLERALGLPVRGWMVLPGDRYLRLGTGEDAGRVGDPAGTRRAVEGADVVVLHGLSETAPAWARVAAAEHPAVLVFPADPWPEEVPFGAGRSTPGDWYPVPELPSSPVASLLAGVAPGDAPPLTTLRPDAPTGHGVDVPWAPLHVRLGRQGEPQPALLAGRTGGRRVVVALGTGYWRWAFATAGGRELYDRLWSAMAAWLLEAQPGSGPEAVRPAARVVPRGEDMEWLVPGGSDSVRVGLTAMEGSGVAPTDTTVSVTGGRARSAALPPGRYRYDVSVGGASTASGEGELTVEAYSPELSRPPVPLRLGGAAANGTVGGVEGGRAGPATPLHATPWPYAVVVLLLCAEWVLRRRWGLR